MLGVTESVATRIEGSPLNSDLDAANPGVLPPGSRRSGLLITEVMYNPRFGTTTANDAPWEWIEVFNNTGAVIDFTQTPYVLDDHSDAGAVPDQANLTLGRIPAGEAAILYDGAISEATFAAAWNRPSQSLNLIPVDEFPSLGNTSETIGIWGSFAKYREDRAVGVESVAQAVASLSYASGGDWPSSIQGASLYQLDLNSPSNEGANWALSGLNDAIASWNAHAVLGVIDDHDGGDLGSPGILLSPASPPNLSFNGDELINSDDVNSLVLEIIAAKAGNTPRRSFDVNNDGTVDNADLTLWLASAAHQNGFAEPYLRGDANIDGSVTFADFVALNNAWQHHDRSWIGGDFNADGVTNFADFVDLNNHWQQSITARTAPLSVPEPSVFALLGAAVVLRGMRRSLR